MTTYYTPKALFTIYGFSEGAGNFLNIITKEVMSAQSLNGHHVVHGVTFANFAEGTRIEGKLSDIVKEAKRNCPQAYYGKELISDAEIKKAELSGEIDAMMKRIEARANLVKTLTVKEPAVYEFELLPDVIYTWLSFEQIVKLPNMIKSTSTLRAWVIKGKIKHVKGSRPTKVTLEEVKYIMSVDKAHRLQVVGVGVDATAAERRAMRSKEYYRNNKEKRAEYFANYYQREKGLNNG